MSITQQQLLQILPNAGAQVGVFVPVLNTAMNAYQIVTTQRVAAFLAQVGHESGQLRSVVENLNYGAQALVATWPSRFTPALAVQVARQPQQIANIAYANRMGNGDASSGDGWAFRGRGLIQITGRANYQACGDALGVDLIGSPDLLAQPQYAAMSAAWYWATNGLNTLADALPDVWPDTSRFDAITQRINGGQNGAADRQALYATAQQVLA